MTIDEYMSALNEAYKRKDDSMDDIEFNRYALLGLDTVNDTKENIDVFICCILGYDRLNRYDKDLKNKYLLSIGYDSDGKPKVEEIYDVWLNLDTMEIAIYKPYDMFSEDDNCIKINDYRIIERLTWRDLISDGK